MMVLPVSVNDLESIQRRVRAALEAHGSTVGSFFAGASQLGGLWTGTAASSFYALCDELHAIESDLVGCMEELAGPIIGELLSGLAEASPLIATANQRADEYHLELDQGGNIPGGHVWSSLDLLEDVQRHDLERLATMAGRAVNASVGQAVVALDKNGLRSWNGHLGAGSPVGATKISIREGDALFAMAVGGAGKASGDCSAQAASLNASSDWLSLYSSDVQSLDERTDGKLGGPYAFGTISAMTHAISGHVTSYSQRLHQLGVCYSELEGLLKQAASEYLAADRLNGLEAGVTGGFIAIAASTLAIVPSLPADPTFGRAIAVYAKLQQEGATESTPPYNAESCVLWAKIRYQQMNGSIPAPSLWKYGNTTDPAAHGIAFRCPAPDGGHTMFIESVVNNPGGTKTIWVSQGNANDRWPSDGPPTCISITGPPFIEAGESLNFAGP